MTDRSAYNQQLIAEFRANGGGVGGGMAGRPLLLLTTTGSKSGAPHTSPMMYLRDGERLIVIASNMGAARDPDWCHNLRAQPQVGVEVSGEEYTATAHVLTGEERARVWTTLIAQYPFFADHQTQTERGIPLVALERQPQEATPHE